MSVGRPWDLLIALAPLLWVAYSWRGTLNRPALLLKGFSLLAIIVAYSEPAIRIPESKTGVAVLVDVSKGMTDGDLKHASSLVTQIGLHRQGNWMKVIPFAAEPRIENGNRAPLSLRRVSTPADHSTNLEAALTGGIAAIPEGYIPKVVLIGNGRESEGSALRSIAALQRLHIPVDTIPLSRHPKADFYLAAFSMPGEAYAGEQIPIDLAIHSAGRTSARVELNADGKLIGASQIELQAGSNSVRVHARVDDSGATFISGRVTAPALGAFQFENTVVLRPAKVLYISEDPPGSDSNLLAAFKQADYEVTRDGPSSKQDINRFQLVVLNNLDLNRISSASKREWVDYVEKGGGLLLISGERQVYKEPARMDALDRILPASMAPPRKPHGMCVALVLDKSSSMEGKKIELARLSAIGVVDHLKPTDTIGVLMFDNSFQWAVPLRRAEDKSFIERLISGITPDGGTQIAPALAEAYHRVLQSGATYKHIVLLTDGISEEGDSIDLAKEAGQHETTISTVGLGQDVNRSYLERVAAASGGKSYFLDDPQGLEQIVLKDVIDYSGSSAVERSLTPIVQERAEILDGIDMQTAPPLKGYIRFESKPTAQTLLSIDKGKRDPLYVQWQYGLGHAAVFTSDAKSRWAQSWIGWPGFDRFWINVSHGLLSRIDETEARVDYDAANGNLLVSYRLGPGADFHGEPPQIFVLGPRNFRKPVDLAMAAPGLYKGRVHIGELTGEFHIRPLKESKAFPEIGYLRPREGTQVYDVNESLLHQLSDFTGGRFDPDPASVFGASGQSIIRSWQLWPALLGLAVALNMIELCVRKRNSLLAILKWRP